MVVRLKNKFGKIAVISATATVMSTTAQAQGVTSVITSTISAGGFIPTIITAGLGFMALLEIVSKWKPIFEGSDVFKNLSVIGALIGLTVWWKTIVAFILNLTAV